MVPLYSRYTQVGFKPISVQLCIETKTRLRCLSFSAPKLVTPPSQRVMGILGIDDDDSGHEPHPLFSEMGELFCDANGEMEWHETAR